MRELSDWSLAIILAFATLLGGVSSAVIDTLFIDPDTERQSNVQLIQVAIGILSEEARELDTYDPGKLVLREWAVDTINAAAEVKFDKSARQLLTEGRLVLPPVVVAIQGSGNFRNTTSFDDFSAGGID